MMAVLNRLPPLDFNQQNGIADLEKKSADPEKSKMREYRIKPGTVQTGFVFHDRCSNGPAKLCQKEFGNFSKFGKCSVFPWFWRFFDLGTSFE